MSDRNIFYQFTYNHLTKHDISLICTMSDGETERQSDIDTAFELQERDSHIQGIKNIISYIDSLNISLYNKIP